MAARGRLVLACRELERALGLTAMAEGLVEDRRTGKKPRHTMVALLRQSVFQPTGRALTQRRRTAAGGMRPDRPQARAYPGDIGPPFTV